MKRSREMGAKEAITVFEENVNMLFTESELVDCATAIREAAAWEEVIKNLQNFGFSEFKIGLCLMMGYHDEMILWERDDAKMLRAVCLEEE